MLFSKSDSFAKAEAIPDHGDKKMPYETQKPPSSKTFISAGQTREREEAHS